MTRPTDCSQHATLSMPEGYVARYEWREAMAKTHDQVWCAGCERWAIYRPKAKAEYVSLGDDDG